MRIVTAPSCPTEAYVWEEFLPMREVREDMFGWRIGIEIIEGLGTRKRAQS